MLKPSLLTLAAVLALGCGGDDEEAPPAAPPPPPSLAVGLPTTVNVAAVAAGVDAETGAINLTFNVAAPGRYQCDARASGLDAQMKILNGASEVARDSDSGEGYDARITRELTPGSYTVRVWEWRRRPGAITVTCAVAPQVAAVPPAPSALALGAPATFQVAAGEGAGSRPELALTIPAAGNYQCDAHAEVNGAQHDAQLALVQNGRVLQQDSDSGEQTDARLVRALTPGVYMVRVWEWRHRAATITVSCAPQAAVATVAAGTPLVLGAPSTVAIAAGQGAIGQVELPLTVPAAGRYQCDAHSGEADAQMAIVQGGNVLQEDSDSGEGRDAQIIRELPAGAYSVRVWEWMHRATNITVSCRPVT